MKKLQLLLSFLILGLGLVWGQMTPDTPAPDAPAPSAAPATPAPAQPMDAPATAPVTPPAVPPNTPPSSPEAPKHHSSRAARALQALVDQPKMAALPVGFKEGDTSAPDYWVAHRFIDDYNGSGWGWVRKKDGGWGNATWVALKENPGVVAAPFRHLTKHELDNNWEYKFWGHLADYKAYDAHLDERLTVFILEGYEVIGPANPLTRKPGPSDRHMHAVSSASSRTDRPIQGSTDE